MRALEPDDVFKLRVASDPQIAPDGTRVAFVVTSADREKDRNTSSIWLVASDGSSSPRQLTFGDNDNTPRWSPDGQWLAFVSRRGEKAKPQVFLLPAAGGEARALTSRKTGASSPVWAPDGKRLAFASPVDLEGEKEGADDDPVEKHKPVVTTTGQYKSDGAGLLGTMRSHLFVTDLDGRTAQVTAGDFFVGTPAWSPDGTTLTFASALHPGRDLDMASHVFVVDVPAAPVPAPDDGGEGPNPAQPRAVTSGLTAAATPSFAPDGASIVFAGARHLGVGHTRLFVVGVGGGEPVEVAADLDRNIMVGGPGYPGAVPRFTPDGASLLFCARDLGSTHLYRAAAGGADAVKLVGDDVSSIAGLSVSADGAWMAYVQATPDTSGEVWVARITGEEARPLTQINADAMAEVTLRRPEGRRFPAPDGTAVHGWVLRDRDAPTPGPLLLDVHGGPHNAWNPNFDGIHLYHQVLAAQGWTVVFVNPRGSDGYGESFYTGLVKDGWGRADTDDFMAAVDALIEEGIADPKRVAVTGYSYGGYMTCWLTATTDRFASAVAGGVVSDLVSFIGTSDIGPSFGGLELGGLPWEDPERLAASSPMSFVDRVKAPTLIVHGENDIRCPVGQAEEWFAALRCNGIETELVRYPGGSHLFILDGPPSQRADWCRRVVAWLTSHT